MVLAERPGTPDPSSKQLPLEEQGVCVVETKRKKKFYFTQYPQDQIDYLEDGFHAWKNLAAMSFTNNLAPKFRDAVVLVWGKGLMNKNRSTRKMLRSRAAIEEVETDIPYGNNMVVIELVRRIKLAQEQLGDWRKYSSSPNIDKDIPSTAV